MTRLTELHCRRPLPPDIRKHLIEQYNYAVVDDWSFGPNVGFVLLCLDAWRPLPIQIKYHYLHSYTDVIDYGRASLQPPVLDEFMGSVLEGERPSTMLNSVMDKTYDIEYALGPTLNDLFVEHYDRDVIGTIPTVTGYSIPHKVGDPFLLQLNRSANACINSGPIATPRPAPVPLNQAWLYCSFRSKSS